MDDQRKYQKLLGGIEELWKTPATFLSRLYNYLLEIYDGQMSFDQMQRALKYLQDSGSLVNSKGAQMLFHSMSFPYVNTNQAITFPQFQSYINKNSMNKLPKQFSVLFQERTAYSRDQALWEQDTDRKYTDYAQAWKRDWSKTKIPDPKYLSKDHYPEEKEDLERSVNYMRDKFKNTSEVFSEVRTVWGSGVPIKVFTNDEGKTWHVSYSNQTYKTLSEALKVQDFIVNEVEEDGQNAVNEGKTIDAYLT